MYWRRLSRLGAQRAKARSQKGHKARRDVQLLVCCTCTMLKQQRCEGGIARPYPPKKEALVRVELTMADLQSAALATWLQRHVFLQLREIGPKGQ